MSTAAGVEGEADTRPFLAADSEPPCAVSPQDDRLRDAGPLGSTQVPVLLLTFFGGIGGFLFGYDTSAISGALPYLTDELLEPYRGQPERLAFLQETIVSAAVAGAAIGSALGGALCDACGRRSLLLFADAFFIAGSILMCSAAGVAALIVGRVAVGLGIGVAAVAVPMYIAEVAPKSVRAGLVTFNTLMITSGQFCAYLADYSFTFMPGTWRWMLGAPALPALLQAAGLLFLPESPRWLAQRAALCAAGEGQADALGAGGLQRARAADLARTALCEPAFRAQLALGVGLQVLQQAAGINTVMYYAPVLLAAAGVRGRRAALLVALAPAATNALGTAAGLTAIDRCGRRKLLLGSLAGVVAALSLLGFAFWLAEAHSPALVPLATGTCPVTGLQDCTHCIRQGCTFCGSDSERLGLGVCMAAGQACPAARVAHEVGCPSRYTGAVVAALLLYLAAFSPGLGPVPWAVNAEIYPLPVRGVACGAAATANWATNAVVSQTFLSLTRAIGSSGTFWLYAAVAAVGMVWVYCTLPETSGLTLDEVQKLFHKKYEPDAHLPDGSLES